MKKKLLLITMSIVMVLSCVLGMTACSDDLSKYNGTYYAYSVSGSGDNKTAVLMSGYTLVLKDGECTATSGSNSQKGKYTVNGNKITIEGREFEIIEDGVFMYMPDPEDGHGMCFCKEGKTPTGYTVIDND